MNKEIKYQLPDIWFYILGVRLYFMLAWCGSFIFKKHHAFIEGRRNTRRQLSEFHAGGKPVIWVHCASLGEFEQARPIIEQIRKDHPGKHFIALSFFSPSGYEIRQNHPLIDWCFYLPMDSPSEARHLLDVLRPKMVFWIKNEFWLFMLRALHKRNIPVYLVSSNFRKGQWFFHPLGGILRQALHCFTHIFEQTDEGVKLLQDIGIRNVRKTYDTRFDRVFMNSIHNNPDPRFLAFSKNSKVFVAGSTWAKDEKIILSAVEKGLFDGFKLIIAPHQPEEEEIIQLIEKLPGPAIRFSQMQHDTDYSGFRFLILDTFGQLASVYKIATAAYVGGGFGVSVHNVLEPAVFGIPVIFGPNYGKSAEAVALSQRHAAYPIHEAHEFETILKDISRLSVYYSSSKKASQYVAERLGGTQAILHQAESEHCL